ncbi:MAG: lipoprotein LpqH [Mycobacteriaceae bacterium]
MRRSALLWTLIPCVALAVSCSDKAENSTKVAASASTIDNSSAAGGASVASGEIEVTVEGRKLDGLAQNGVTCEKALDRIVIHNGDDKSEEGFTVILADSDPLTVESLSVVADGAILVVGSAEGADAGKAEVRLSGKTYTITGESVGIDMANPTEQVSKRFTISVTCG